jgi:PAS domain S-box-containing protein
MQNDELRRTQEILEESRSRYLDLYDFAPIGYLTLDKLGFIKEANLTTARLLQVERSQLIDRHFAHFMVTEDRAAFRRHLNLVFEGEERQTVELRLKRKDGQEFFALLESACYRDITGSSLCRTAFTDITERRQAEESVLRVARDKFRDLIQASPLPIISTDTAGRLTSWNAAAERTFGWRKDEVLGNFPPMVPEDWQGRFSEIHGRQLRGDLGVDGMEVPVCQKDGAIRTARLFSTPQHTATGEVMGAVSIFEDITERKRAEEALLQRKQLLKSIFRVAPVGIGLVFDRVIQEAIETLCLMTGYAREQLVGQSARMLYPSEEDYNYVGAEKYRQIAERGTGAVETRWKRQDGEIRHIILSSTPLDPTNLSKGVTFTALDITERKRAEESIKEGLRLRQQILDTIPSPIFYIGTDGRYQGVNHSFLQFYGKPMEQVLGKTVHEVFPKKIADKYLKMDQDLFQNPGIQVYEFHNYNAQGQKREISLQKATFLNQDGNVAGLAGIMIDITERKQAEEAMKRLHHQYQLILSSAAEGILGLDLEGKHVFVNYAAAKMLRYEAEELIGFQSHAIWHNTRVNGSPYPEEECPICETLKKAKPYFGSDEVFWRKDGTSFPVDYATAPIIKDGRVSGVVVTFWDISERREAEEAFKSLVNHAPIGIYIVQDGKFAMVNPGFEVLTGYHAQELLGQYCLSLVAPEYKALVREKAIRRLKGIELPPYEYRFIAKSGETGWVLETVTPTKYQGEKAVLGYFMDISPLKQLEEQFLQAQKMEAVGTLAGGIAHDFNNILTAILGNIGLAALDDKIGTRSKKRLAQAEAACLRAEALSQQLLTFAKGGAPIKKIFSLAELLTESTAFTCVGSPVKCKTTFPENLWSIAADPGQIGQVFQNLIINAIQAMPTGGTITVWAENFTLGTDSGMPLGAGRYIKISVRDQGMGIPAEHLPRIFDPYFTTKQKGSGLGLASAYAIVNKHHGHIAVESKPGVGTTFTIYLPAVEQQVIPQPEEDRALRVGTGKILVMDDEEMVREVLGRLLVRLGYETEFARDGGEAIELFVQAQGSGQAFTAVILDLTVPGGMGGKETMARLLEIDPQVKAIVSSGYSDDPIMADFQKYGFSGVIAKPYRISKLGKILQEVIHLPGHVSRIH